MKYIGAAILLLFMITFSSCISQEKNLTGEKIWSNYIKKLGPKDALYNIRSFRDSTISVTNNDTIFNITRVKYPDKIHHQVYRPNGIVDTLIINGKKGIKKSQGTIELLSPEFIEYTREWGLIYPEIYYDELGYKINLVGTEEINSIEYYIIEVISKNRQLKYFISKKEFSMLKMIERNTIVEIKDVMFVNGIKFIKESKIEDKNGIYKRFRIKTEINPFIDDNIFELL